MMLAQSTPRALAQLWTPEVAIVRSKRHEAKDIVTLAVARAEPSLLTYRPGQFNMLHLPTVGEIAISISGLNAARNAYLHTIRAVGAVSRALCNLPRGAMLGMRGPYGSAWPLASLGGGELLIVAGGLGLAPLRPAVRWALRNRRRFSDLFVVYGAKDYADLVYARDRQHWSGKNLADVRVSIDHPDRQWHGPVGTPLTILPQSLTHAQQAAALVCGPERMMQAVAEHMLGLGVSAERIFVSMERNMQCALGNCGRCQFGPYFVCRDGPVFAYARVAELMRIKEL